MGTAGRPDPVFICGGSHNMMVPQLLDTLSKNLVREHYDPI